jgi:hypothetical protein
MLDCKCSQKDYETERETQMPMNQLQAEIIVINLEFEISMDGKMSFGEPAMKSLGRLLNFDAYAQFGKGVKGRQKALEWLKEAIAEAEKQEA